MTAVLDTPVPEAPANIEAEQALLGAILVANRAYEAVGHFLRPEHFHLTVHGRIYAAIGKLIDRGQVANPVTLKNLFDRDGALAEIGGAAYLARLAASAVTIINAEGYGRTIYDLYLRRQLIELGRRLSDAAVHPDAEEDAYDVLAAHEQALAALADDDGVRPREVALSDALQNSLRAAEDAYKAGGRRGGIETGFPDLDRRLGGLHPGELIVLAGRPSMGKSSLASQIAVHVARQTSSRCPVGYFSLEETAEQQARRVLAAWSGVPSERQRRGELNGTDFDALVEAGARLAGVPLYIEDASRLSLADLRLRARRLKRRHGLGLVVVDYLQLMDSPGHESRVQEISDISRGLKSLAKELAVPVLALSQLSRAVESREDKRPMLADLRESGSIEQDADVVMFIYRQEYYLARSEPQRRAEEDAVRFNDRYERWQQALDQSRNLAEVFVAKQRQGAIGTVKLRWDGALTRFDSIAERGVP